jgi:hypothetical protein
MCARALLPFVVLSLPVFSIDCFAPQKWSKGKLKEKVNNLVLFDKVRC